jgi:tRNA dimethylallyltransferase
LTGFHVLLLGLNPDREQNYARIDERVRRMFAAGLVQEVERLIALGTPLNARAFGAIGYRQVVANLEGCNSWEDTVRIIQRETRRYAKRQMTWFRRQPGVMWFDGPGDDTDVKEKARRFVQTALSKF